MSITLTVNAQVLVFRLESLAWHVTVVTPLLNVEPLEGEQTTGTAPWHASFAAGLGHVTLALQAPAAVELVKGPGQPVITGAAESVTVNVATELVTLPTLETTA